MLGLIVNTLINTIEAVYVQERKLRKKERIKSRRSI